MRSQKSNSLFSNFSFVSCQLHYISNPLRYVHFEKTFSVLLVCTLWKKEKDNLPNSRSNIPINKLVLIANISVHAEIYFLTQKLAEKYTNIPALQIIKKNYFQNNTN